MEVHMNFEKKTLSKRVGKFLEENIQDQEEKESVRKIMQGRKLQYLAANKLILTLITAMVMGDGEEDGEDEVQDAGEGQDGQTQPQTQTQASTSSQEPQDGTQSQRSEKPDFSKVCKFYKNGDCKFGTNCRLEHPKFCKKFVKHGLQRHNQSGCDSKCGKLHPNACRSSLRTKECDREKCRFFHIKGTKNTFKQSPEGGWGEREKKMWREESRMNDPKKEARIENREEMKTRDQVFLESQQALIQMLAKLNEKMDFQMEEMKGWTQKTQTHQPYKIRPEPLQWRIPQREGQWASQ